MYILAAGFAARGCVSQLQVLKEKLLLNLVYQAKRVQNGLV